MPFTFSHPAIILPLPRLWPRLFSLTGLVAGSIVPDFEYFLRVRVFSSISHTIPGLFLFDLPFGLLLALLFHLLIRDPLIRHLPVFLKARFLPFLNSDWVRYFQQHYLVVVSSVMLGAFSHQFWDGFTHEPEFFVERIPALSQLVTVAGYEVEMYRIIQHTSSVVGAIIIAWYVQQLPKASVALPRATFWQYWFIVALTMVLVFLIRIVVPQQFDSIGNMGVAVISGGLLGLIVASAVFRSKVGG